MLPTWWAWLLCDAYGREGMAGRLVLSELLQWADRRGLTDEEVEDVLKLEDAYQEERAQGGKR